MKCLKALSIESKIIIWCFMYLLLTSKLMVTFKSCYIWGEQTSVQGKVDAGKDIRICKKWNMSQRWLPLLAWRGHTWDKQEAARRWPFETSLCKTWCWKSPIAMLTILESADSGHSGKQWPRIRICHVVNLKLRTNGLCF